MGNFSISAGGVCIKDDKVLLVKIGYGANHGMWMIPGGLVELGESVEEAAIREVKEETGLDTEIIRMVSLRSGTMKNKEGMQTSLYVVFEMADKSGLIKKDDSEISDIRYWGIKDIQKSEQVIDLTKEIIMAAWTTKNGLYQGNSINTKNKYRSYSYYIPNN